MADMGYGRSTFKTALNPAAITLIRPTFGKDTPRLRQPFMRPFRETIEVVDQTLKPQLELDDTADAPAPASAPAQHNDFTRSPPLSGTTKPANDQAQPAASPPTTTDP